MNYKLFDKLNNMKSKKQIVELLKKAPMSFDELANKTHLNRTSVFYHIKQLSKEDKIEKRFQGKVEYVGLKKALRRKTE